MELELRQGLEYHSEAIRVNSARNALALLIRIYKIKKILLPYYTCAVVLEAVRQSGCEHEFYHLDQNLLPQGLSGNQSFSDWLVYTNYFGLCERQVKQLKEKCPNLIIDNAQAFFAQPIKGVPTIYSCRKFFGVPDGAYLYPGETVDTKALDLAPSHSYAKSSHLLKRIELGPEKGYPAFKRNEEKLSKEPIRYMSELSRRIMTGIDYKSAGRKRRGNYQYLHHELCKINELSSDVTDLGDAVPLCYPLLISNLELHHYLISSRVYVPVYWENVCQWVSSDSWECHLAEHLVALPIDQRYSEQDMQYLINVVLNKASG